MNWQRATTVVCLLMFAANTGTCRSQPLKDYCSASTKTFLSETLIDSQEQPLTANDKQIIGMIKRCHPSGRVGQSLLQFERVKKVKLATGRIAFIIAVSNAFDLKFAVVVEKGKIIDEGLVSSNV